MERKAVADIIRETTFWHLTENNGLLLGESISAVGWVNNTVPNCKGIVELPMTDVAGAGIAVGAAVVGRRPIFVIRFQDFLILNGSPLIFYAAKTKELHGKSTPLFIRAIAADGIGPVHSGVLHSIFMHFPGFKVCAPMTPLEYKKIWNFFLENDDPMIVSEHRESYSNTEELSDIIVEDADITIYGISNTRFNIIKAIDMLNNEGLKCNFINILWLKPFNVTERILNPLLNSKVGIVVDSGYEICGAAEHIALKLTNITGKPVNALGLEDKTKCLCPPYQNKVPDADKIYNYIAKLLKE